MSQPRIDPNEWANQRKQRLQRAAEIRAARKLGIIDNTNQISSAVVSGTATTTTSTKQTSMYDDDTDDEDYMQSQRQRNNRSRTSQYSTQSSRARQKKSHGHQAQQTRETTMEDMYTLQDTPNSHSSVTRNRRSNASSAGRTRTAGTSAGGRRRPPSKTIDTNGTGNTTGGKGRKEGGGNGGRKGPTPPPSINNTAGGGGNVHSGTSTSHYQGGGINPGAVGSWEAERGEESSRSGRRHLKTAGGDGIRSQAGNVGYGDNGNVGDMPTSRYTLQQYYEDIEKVLHSPSSAQRGFGSINQGQLSARESKRKHTSFDFKPATNVSQRPATMAHRANNDAGWDYHGQSQASGLFASPRGKHTGGNNNNERVGAQTQNVDPMQSAFPMYYDNSGSNVRSSDSAVTPSQKKKHYNPLTYQSHVRDDEDEFLGEDNRHYDNGTPQQQYKTTASRNRLSSNGSGGSNSTKASQLSSLDAVASYENGLLSGYEDVKRMDPELAKALLGALIKEEPDLLPLLNKGLMRLIRTHVFKTGGGGGGGGKQKNGAGVNHKEMESKFANSFRNKIQNPQQQQQQQQRQQVQFSTGDDTDSPIQFAKNSARGRAAPSPRRTGRPVTAAGGLLGKKSGKKSQGQTEDNGYGYEEQVTGEDKRKARSAGPIGNTERAEIRKRNAALRKRQQESLAKEQARKGYGYGGESDHESSTMEGGRGAPGRDGEAGEEAGGPRPNGPYNESSPEVPTPRSPDYDEEALMQEHYERMQNDDELVLTPSTKQPVYQSVEVSIPVNTNQFNEDAVIGGGGGGGYNLPDNFEEMNDPFGTKSQLPMDNEEQVIGGGSGAGAGGRFTQTQTQYEEENVQVDLRECPDCGRRFASDRLAKHANVCKKVFATKRPKFDSTKARVKGTEAAKFVAKQRRAAKNGGGGGSGSGSSGGGKIKKSAKWRREHQEFINNIRAARGAPPIKSEYSGGGFGGDEGGEQPDDGMKECPHCNRTFNETAAERHIPRCANIRAKPKRLQRKQHSYGGVKR